MTVRAGDAVALAQLLITEDSRNPSLVRDAPGEKHIANTLANTLIEWGLDARLQDAAPNRPNVIAVIPGSGGGRSLMFNGHLDVVGVEGMSHAPFDGFRRGGRLYGRGASDMKGGVAAMCAAAARVRGTLRGDVILTAVADEEWQSLGTNAVIASGLRADAAIVTEPTRLAIMPAHKGFVWARATVAGRAAHGSRWDLGVDAIRHAGLLLSELDRMDAEDLPRRRHSLLGRPSLHASSIAGGNGLSTYPDRCTLEIERRTLPGETAAEVKRELDSACERVRQHRSSFAADVEIIFAQPPSDVPVDAPIVEVLSSALSAHIQAAIIDGMSAWTDAALLNDARIPAICFGPGDMALAHADEEYIEVGEIEAATDILVSLARTWCN